MLLKLKINRQFLNVSALFPILFGMAACDSLYFGPKHMKPVGTELEFKMEQRDMDADAPIMVRIFKQENELEIWKENRQGKFAHLDTYDICAWSGNLGPKLKEGDRQSPEGFYSVGPQLMNPRSSYHLAFNIGFPNSFDRSHGRTGSHLMVHGECSSRGCYAMENHQMERIYALARDAFKGGQKEFQVQAYPFRLTNVNLARNHQSPHFDFWKNLKEGFDHFEITRTPPKVDVCDRSYVFNATPDSPRRSFKPTSACPDYSIPESIGTALEFRQRKFERELEFEVAKSESRKNSLLLALFDSENTDNARDSEVETLERSNFEANGIENGNDSESTGKISDLIGEFLRNTGEPTPP